MDNKKDHLREKWRSPTENLAPFTCTGRYTSSCRQHSFWTILLLGNLTLLPLLKFLMSQFPPCSGRPNKYQHLDSNLESHMNIIPGIVLAPSRPTFVLISSDAEPACTFWGLGGWATILSSLLAAINSPSRLFHVARTYNPLSEYEDLEGTAWNEWRVN